MSDDAWAPHEWEFTVAPGTTLADLIQIAIDDHYLATISAAGRRGWLRPVACRSPSSRSNGANLAG
jgi:hypothetical protein